jgi:acyl carrier protein
MQEAKEILSGCLFVPIERIGDDVSMQSIKELDSLSFAAITVELEDRVGREIDPVDLIKLRTVRDLAGLIERYR